MTMSSPFGDSWLDGPAVDPDTLPAQVVDNATRWDWRDWEHAKKELSALRASMDAMDEFADTGLDLMTDAFMALFKVSPRLTEAEGVRPSHLVNLMVMGQMLDLAEYLELHRYTTGDDVAAGMACASLEPDLEELLDRERTRQGEADEMEELLRELANAVRDEAAIAKDLDELVERWSQERAEEAPPEPAEDPQEPAEGDEGDEADEDGEGEGEGEGEPLGCEGEGTPQPGPGQPGGMSVPGAGELQAKLGAAGANVADLKARVKAAAKALMDGLGGDSHDVRRKMKEALQRAADEARTLVEQCDAWGVEKGELQRMPADERLALAKRLNNPRFRRIAELFGPMKHLMFTEQSRTVPYVKADLVDIEYGKDVARLLPSELLKLRDPNRKMLFYKDFTQGRLLQYRLEGEEKVGKGGIILCEDGSGSMKGERELWAKAVMLCLLHLARQQNRAFHLIHFGSKHELYPVSFTKPEDFTTERILAAAELFCNGGTDFEAPLNMAVERLQAEHKAKGRVEGDIVFLTDGYCGVSDQWMSWFREEQERLQFMTWGVNIVGDTKAEPLGSICDGRVASVADLLSGGDVRQVFGGVGRRTLGTSRAA